MALLLGLLYTVSVASEVLGPQYIVILLSRKYLDFEGTAGNISVNNAAILMWVTLKTVWIYPC